MSSTAMSLMSSAIARDGNHLAIELARLDALQETFYRKAQAGDVKAGHLVSGLIKRRCVILGLHAPQTAVLQIIAEQQPKQTSTDKIEVASNALLADQRKDRR
jgi:hypothetical protein